MYFLILDSSNTLKSEKMKQFTICLEFCSLWRQDSNSFTLLHILRFPSLLLQWQIPSSSLSNLSSIHFISLLSSLHWNDYAQVTKILLLQCVVIQFLICILLNLWVIISSFWSLHLPWAFLCLATKTPYQPAFFYTTGDTINLILPLFLSFSSSFLLLSFLPFFSSFLPSSLSSFFLSLPSFLSLSFLSFTFSFSCLLFFLCSLPSSLDFLNVVHSLT